MGGREYKNSNEDGDNREVRRDNQEKTNMSPKLEQPERRKIVRDIPHYPMLNDLDGLVRVTQRNPGGRPLLGVPVGGVAQFNELEAEGPNC